MLLPYYMILFISKLSIIFSISYNHITYNYNICNYTVTGIILSSCFVTYVTVIHDITSYPSPKFKIKKSKNEN